MILKQTEDNYDMHTFNMLICWCCQCSCRLHWQ